MKLKIYTAADRDRLRYATDEVYRAERRQHAHARKRGVAPLPSEAIASLTEYFEGRCAYCPAHATTWDHIVAVAQGGRTEPGNIVPACGACNSRKRDMDVLKFIDKYNVEYTPQLEAMLGLGFMWGQLS